MCVTQWVPAADTELGGTLPSGPSSHSVNKLPFGDLGCSWVLCFYWCHYLRCLPRLVLKWYVLWRHRRLMEQAHLLDSYTQDKSQCGEFTGNQWTNKGSYRFIQKKVVYCHCFFDRPCPQGHKLTGTNLYFLWDQLFHIHEPRVVLQKANYASFKNNSRERRLDQEKRKLAHINKAWKGRESAGIT